MKFSIKNALFLAPLLFFTALWWQATKPFYYVNPLAAAKPASPAEISVATWQDGSFQEKHATYLNDNFGFRPEFVRWWREMEFHLFDKLNSGDIAVGKQNTLFGGTYIDAYFGKDRRSEQEIKDRVLNLKKLSDNLSQQGKTLIVIMAADKTAFQPDMLPSNRVFKKNMTNQQLFEMYATEAHLPYLNFRNYINSLRGKTPYPLFPQTGVHWSQYCGSIVLDSITKYIAAQRNIQVPHPKIERYTLSNKPIGNDWDLEWLSNLKFPIRLTEPLAYPVYAQADTTGKTKPSVLAIGDSYYVTIRDQKVSEQIFKQHIYIDYARAYFINDNATEKPIADFNYKKVIADTDVIILMATSTNLHQIGWENVDRINALYQK